MAFLIPDLSGFYPTQAHVTTEPVAHQVTATTTSLLPTGRGPYFDAPWATAFTLTP